MPTLVLTGIHTGKTEVFAGRQFTAGRHELVGLSAEQVRTVANHMAGHCEARLEEDHAPDTTAPSDRDEGHVAAPAAQAPPLVADDGAAARSPSVSGDRDKRRWDARGNRQSDARLDRTKGVNDGNAR